jgi:hypothetical protein
LELTHGKRRKGPRGEGFVSDVLRLTILSGLIPKGNGTDGGDTDCPLLLGSKLRQSRHFGYRSLTIELLGFVTLPFLQG